MHKGRIFSVATGVVLALGLAATALPASAATPTAKVAPSKNLTNGKSLKVSGKGWPANDSLVIVECNGAAGNLTDLNACNENNIVSVAASSKGVVPATPFVFSTGTIGDGTCNPGQSCFVVLTEASATGLHALVPVTVKKAKK
jgi:hypothetical protein